MDFNKEFFRKVLTQVATRVADGVVFQTGVRAGNAACDGIAKLLGFETPDKKSSK